MTQSSNMAARLLILLWLVLGAGCAVYTPAGSVVVDPHPGGGFCPPGQAKKGNC